MWPWSYPTSNVISNLYQSFIHLLPMYIHIYTINGTEWPYLCWIAIKELLTHLWKAYGGSRLTWSDLWKNRLVKQKLKGVTALMSSCNLLIPDVCYFITGKQKYRTCDSFNSQSSMFSYGIWLPSLTCFSPFILIFCAFFWVNPNVSMWSSRAIRIWSW